MIPDFSGHLNRLTIKSAICSYWRVGEWIEEVTDAEGNVVTPRTLVQPWPDDSEIVNVNITPTQLIIITIQQPNRIFTLDGTARGYYNKA